MEQLTGEELAYHHVVMAQMRSAQAVWQSWSAHLAQRYSLAPDDTISESGIIQRAGDGSQPDSSTTLSSSAEPS